MRVEEARTLCNMRQRERNLKNDKPLNEGMKTKVGLGRLLWPNSNNPSENHNVMIKRSEDGTRGFNQKAVEIICHEYGVDPNFIFDFESIHDFDYERLS